MERTTEKKTAEVLLQEPLHIEVGKRVYDVPQPTIATLAMASEAISRMPAMKLDENNIVQEVLSKADYGEVIGDVMAVIILGAKRIRSGSLWHRIMHKSKRKELAQYIVQEIEIKDLFRIFSYLLSSLEIQDFFALTTFLTETNLLRPTRRVGNGTTASGQ